MEAYSMILDTFIHRIFVVDKEISTPGTSPNVFLRHDPNGDYLEIDQKEKIRCKLNTPPDVNILIAVSCNSNQVFTTFADDSYRVVEFGTELSSDSDYSVILVFQSDLSTRAKGSYLIVRSKMKSDPRTIPAGGTKIPPQTGKLLADSRKDKSNKTSKK